MSARSQIPAARQQQQLQRQRQRQQQQRAANVQRAQQAANRDQRQLEQQGLTVQSAQQVLDSTSNITSGIPSSAALALEQPSGRGWSSRWNPLNRLPKIKLSLHPNDYIAPRYQRLIGYSILAVFIVVVLAVVIYAFRQTKPHLPDYVPLRGAAAATAATASANSGATDSQRQQSDDRLLRSLREKAETELHELQQKLRRLTLGERSLSRRIDEAHDQLTRASDSGSAIDHRELHIVGADFGPVDDQLTQLTERETRLRDEASSLKDAIEAKLKATIDSYVAGSELLSRADVTSSNRTGGDTVRQNATII